MDSTCFMRNVHPHRRRVPASGLIRNLPTCWTQRWQPRPLVRRPSPRGGAGGYLAVADRERARSSSARERSTQGGSLGIPPSSRRPTPVGHRRIPTKEAEEITPQPPTTKGPVPSITGDVLDRPPSPTARNPPAKKKKNKKKIRFNLVSLHPVPHRLATPTPRLDPPRHRAPAARTRGCDIIKYPKPARLPFNNTLRRGALARATPDDFDGSLLSPKAG